MAVKTPVSIVKIGGAFLEEPELATTFYRNFAGMPGLKVLVHGGGKRATELSRQLGLEPRMVNGRRITDAASLEVAVMVYAGWANKSMVAALQALGCPALGLSGADADLIRARKRPVAEIDYGYVGDIEAVREEALHGMLQAGWVPVFCALTHDGKGQMLNTNADTIAAALAVALSSRYETRLYYCFEKPGVLTDIEDPASRVAVLDRQRYDAMVASGQIATGMLPKLHNCFQALEKGVGQVRIGLPDMLLPGAETFTSICL